MVDWLSKAFQPELAQPFLIRISAFTILVLLSVLLGRLTPSLVRLILKRFAPQRVSSLYGHLIKPIEKTFQVAGTLILISVCLPVLQTYEGFYEFLSFFVNLGVVLSLAWLAARLFRRFLRVYGIDLIRKLGLEAGEMLLILETLVNIVITFMAVVAFAQSQDINLVGLLAGVGIGGIAIAFAAQKTLEQLIGTAVLYLDRPFVRGDYIRVSFNPQGKSVYGRIESIGLRSTKLRSAATSTLVIVPNSMMANVDIENISRGKKVMVLLYLDFMRLLTAPEQALVEQVVKESTDALFGIDPGSTKIQWLQPLGEPRIRARITFFILGSSENSIQLRKRLLELANVQISQHLASSGIEFRIQEPSIYVESPVTI